MFAARFDENFNIVYDRVPHTALLDKFRGAKYAYPRMDTLADRVRKCLEECKIVLFVGLPCQTAALKAALKDTETYFLYCVDLVCHGTPEPAAWESYLRWEEARKGSIKDIRMRDKSKGWRDYRIAIETEKGKIYRESADKNLYMRGYVNNLFLRKPCYHCKFRGIERCSDMTLGDYWGVSSEHPDMDTKGGVSLVLIHSNKGMSLLKCMRDWIECEETDAGYACAQNPSVVQSPEMPDSRNEIVERLKGGEDFGRCIRPFVREKFTTNIRKKCRKIKQAVQII